LIITNKHVVEAGDNYKVILNNKKQYYARLIGKDPLDDLAVLKIDDKNLPYLSMGSSSALPIGTTVIAIGNALGRYDNSVTKGIISGLNRSVLATDPISNQLSSLDNLLQTDAEINEGNSGGPLLNLDGKVVGINVAVDRGGASLGFAIPVDDARSVVDSVRKNGRIIRARLGVRFAMLDVDTADVNNLKRNSGAWITKDDAGLPAVVPGSPADLAGLQDGDIIFQLNNINIDGTTSLLSLIQKFKPGDKITVKLQRGTQVLTKTIILDEFKVN
jgi:serine protease Do